jgi:hypothetical protein
VRGRGRVEWQAEALCNEARHDFLVWPSPRPPVRHVPRGSTPDSQQATSHAQYPRSRQKTSGQQETRPTYDSLSLTTLSFFSRLVLCFLFHPFSGGSDWGFAQNRRCSYPEPTTGTLPPFIVAQAHELAVFLCQSHHVLFLIPFRHSLVPCLRPS